MKTNAIALRLSDSLKSQLENLAIEQGKSTSEITRYIIEDFFSSSNNLIDIQSNLNNSKESSNIDFIQTLGFSELIFWIYEKNLNPEINETNEFYSQLINEIEKLKRHPLFTDEIINEFNKISRELRSYLTNISFSRNDFEFCSEDNQDGFNYELFTDFFYGFRYDENNNRILNIE